MFREDDSFHVSTPGFNAAPPDMFQMSAPTETLPGAPYSICRDLKVSTVILACDSSNWDDRTLKLGCHSTVKTKIKTKKQAKEKKREVFLNSNELHKTDTEI